MIDADVKAAFIDIDGVLLPGRAHRLPRTGFPDPRIHRLDPVAIDMLRELVIETGVKLVWSTSWRKYGTRVLKRIVQENEMDPLWFHSSYKTPDRHHDRAAEIAAWIAEHEPADWFALDDDADLQGEYAGQLLNDPLGMRRPLFSKYDGVSASIYTQASVVLGSDRFAAKYRIGRSRGGAALLYIAYPQSSRLRAFAPDRVVGNFVCSDGVWLRLDGVLEDQDILVEAARSYDVDFDNDLLLNDVHLYDAR